ncbi:MAG: TMEM175 family protein [Bacteroidetes bacterium]|nr:TMEM175 family protein [Bacteroidota bacterium]
MLRDKVIKPFTGRGSYFKWRNHELLRIEALSDAVFAFAITLVVVSLEVPVTFHELLQSMRGMLGFAICFMFIFLIWHQQYLYFRHFGLRDLTSMALNAALLFTVLFYVYPLKFLFTLLTAGNHLMENGEKVNRIASFFELRQLMAIYSGGLIAVYLTYMFLYLHVSKQKEKLKLSHIEQFHLRTQVYKNILILSFGIACLLLLVIVPDENVFATGLIFTLIYPALYVFFKYRERKLLKKMSTEDLAAHLAIVEKSKHSTHTNNL